MATDFSVNGIRDRLIAGLKSKNLWANILKTSTAKSLIDNYAEEEARFAQYVEYLIRENKWSLAQNRSSLVAQARINGYDAKRKIGASGTIKLSAVETFDSPPTTTISIPKYTIFSNGDYNYSTTEAYTLTPSDNFIEVQVLQGTPIIETFEAQGLNLEEFSITNNSIENNNYLLYVNNELWTEVDDIREALPEEEAYEIINELDASGIIIRFGNRIFGKKLELGDNVRLEYFETSGEQGNISGSNQITSVVSTIFDSNNQKVDIFVTNEDKLTGGSAIESKESIRETAPRIGQSGNSATTNDSYEAVVEDIPFVGKAVVWGAVEYNQDQGLPYSTFIPSEENRIRISAFTDSGDQLTIQQQSDIVSLIQNRKAPTDIPLFVEVDFVKLNFVVEAFSNTKTIPLSQTKGNILQGLESNYDLFNFEFKQPLYYSDYVSYIDSITGVGNHNTYIELISETTFDTAYTGDIDLEIFPVKPNLLSVWVQDTTSPTPEFIKIGEDDGSGNIVGEAGYDLGSSVIDYSTGLGNIQVVSGLSGDFNNFEIRIYSQLVSNDIVPIKRNQILRYEESEIVVSYQTGV